MLITEVCHLHSIALCRLSPYHNLPNVYPEQGSGSYRLLAGVNFQTLMTTFAIFCFVCPFSNSSVFLCFSVSFIIFLFTTPGSFFPVK